MGPSTRRRFSLRVTSSSVASCHSSVVCRRWQRVFGCSRVFRVPVPICVPHLLVLEQIVVRIVSPQRHLDRSRSICATSHFAIGGDTAHCSCTHRNSRHFGILRPKGAPAKPFSLRAALVPLRSYGTKVRGLRFVRDQMFGGAARGNGIPSHACWYRPAPYRQGVPTPEILRGSVRVADGRLTNGRGFRVVRGRQRARTRSPSCITCISWARSGCSLVWTSYAGTKPQEESEETASAQ